MKKNLWITGILGLLLFVVACVPPEVEPVDEDTTSITERNEECELYLSFGGTNYQNQDFEGAIRNFSHVVDLGCGEMFSEQIWELLGRSYYQVGKLDSAVWAADRGLVYLSDDIHLMRFAAYVYHKAGDTQKAIHKLEDLWNLDPENTEALWELLDMYRALPEDIDNLKNQKRVLNGILKVESNNNKAMGELALVLEDLGEGADTIVCDRWRQDRCNIGYGLDCVAAMQDEGRDDGEILSILNELKSCERSNIKILIQLANTLLDMGRVPDALLTLEDVVRIEPANYESIFQITQINMDQGDLKEALIWAERGIKTSGSNGESLYWRAEVYFEIAEECAGESMTFEDKVIYEFSFEDYDSAMKKGYRKAKVRRDFLEEHYITKCSDWFMRPEGESQYTPTNACYTTKGINRKLARKKC